MEELAPIFEHVAPIFEHDMFKNMSKKETVTIQTTGQRGGPDISIGFS